VSAALDEESYARAALTYLAEPADLKLGALVRTCGAARTLAAIKAGRFPHMSRDTLFGATVEPHAGGTSDATATSDASRAAGDVGGVSGIGDVTGLEGTVRATAVRAMQRWQVRLGEVPSADEVAGFYRAGIRLACPGDPEWPGQLADLGDAAPYALWLRGSADLRFSCLRSVAIVGSRAATAYGSYVASEFASSLAARGWAVISGGAYGVDAAAHRGALGADGVTVAVLACGVNVPYPAGHQDLLDAVAAQGVVVSEWPPGRNATRLRFLVRNRVIAALAPGTLVVEAGRRSGALNSARHARDLNRRLMAVPGPITSDLSAGCHHIIREWQGTLITCAAEVIECLSPLTAAPGQTPAAVLPRDELDQDTAAVLDALPSRGGMGTAQIGHRAGLEPATVVRCLGALAAGGFAERCAGGWRLRRT
jgi:DNA processing protein